MRKLSFLMPLALGVCSLATSAMADDWVAQKLRGEALVWGDNHWVKLKRGDVVNNSAKVRTMGDGQIELARDRETITLGPNTQIQIFDRVGQRYTTVKEAFGSVRIEANVENVQHFTVQTPFLAATVKGTIFTVVSGAGVGEVKVQRGKVGVVDLLHSLHVDVLPGQIASVGRGKALQIAGKGIVAPVLNAAGQPVTKNANKGNGKSKGDAKSKGDGKSKGNGNGNGIGNGNGNGKGNGNDNGKGNGNGNGNGKP
jgi:hypothetical protein